jgi:subtilisin family serine protease
MTAPGTDDRPTWHAHEPAQLVVSARHLTMVLQTLDLLGVPHESEPERSEELGLALLALADVEGGVERVLRAARDPSTGYQGLTEPQRLAMAAAVDAVGQLDAGAPSAVDALDRLLCFLRAWFADLYRGWRPTFGKNRFVEGIFPFDGGGTDQTRILGEIGGGGGDGPEIVAEGSAYREGVVPRPGRRALPAAVRVGVLDTRVFPHAMLLGRYVVDDDPPAYPPTAKVPFATGHGTFVAGLIVGHAPDAVLEVRGPLSDGSATASAWDVARAMVKFAGSGVSVLNMSFGCVTRDGEPPLLLATAVEMLSPQVVLVAAAGNHGDERTAKVPTNSAVYPAAFDSVVAVGAHDTGGGLAHFSPQQPWVDLTAPGVRVESCYPVAIEPGPGYAGRGRWSGTSFAAAHVSGQIAANTEPSRLEAREVVERLLQLKPGAEFGGVRRFYQ